MAKKPQNSANKPAKPTPARHVASKPPFDGDLAADMEGRLDQLLSSDSGRGGVGHILSRGPKAGFGIVPPQEDASAPSRQDALAEAMHPTGDETRRAGELLNAFFGEFNSAVRTYAFAKHGDHMTPDIEAFMENPNLDTEPAELHKLGWPSFAQLMRELSMPVLHRHQARASGGFAEEDLASETPESKRIRDSKIVPALRRYEDAHGLFDIDATEEERTRAIVEQVPGYAMVVQAMMHDEATRGLYGAVMKKALGEELSEKDRQLLGDENNRDIVTTIEGILQAAGLGYATAPCNQVYRAANYAADKWANFMREEREARDARAEGRTFQADTHLEQAMEAHKEALQAYKAMHQGLGPVCDLVEASIDSPGKSELPASLLDKASELTRTLPELGDNDKVKYNVNRIAGAVQAVFKSKPSEKDTALSYAERCVRINAYAETTRTDTGRLLEQIAELKDAVKDGGSIAISDPKFRNVYMGLRALADRTEMMMTAAEQLYVDMGKITGRQNQEWLSRETEGERRLFTVPANPSDKLRKVAEEMQRTSLSQHELAATRRQDLLAVVNEMGSGVDRFDIIHDFFSRLRDTVGQQVASLQARQDTWDKAHPGTGQSKGV